MRETRFQLSTITQQLIFADIKTIHDFSLWGTRYWVLFSLNIHKSIARVACTGVYGKRRPFPVIQPELLTYSSPEIVAPTRSSTTVQSIEIGQAIGATLINFNVGLPSSFARVLSTVKVSCQSLRPSGSTSTCAMVHTPVSSSCVM